MADHVGRQLLTGLGAMFAAVTISLVGVVSSTSMLLLLLLIGGLGSTALHLAGASVARQALARRTGLAVNIFDAGGAIEVGLGPLLVLATVAWAGPTVTPCLMISGLLVGVTALALIPPTSSARSAGGRSKLFDWARFTGPIGMLALTEVASSLAYLTFASTMPLWPVDVHGVARDATLIGWILATF